MDKNCILIEQYKLIENRRNYCGRLFWQLPSLFIACIVFFISLFARENLAALKSASVIVGIIFLLIAQIAHRLRKSQDECESLLEKLETKIRKEGFEDIISLPKSRKRGARFATIITFIVLGILFILFPFILSNTL